MIIKSVYVKGHDSSYGGYKVKYLATIQIDAAEFKKLKGDLGNLVLRVNNELYKTYKVPAYNPSIDSTGAKRAKNGVKTLVFEYFSNDMELAEHLGLDIMRLKNGETLVKFAACSEVKPITERVQETVARIGTKVLDDAKELMQQMRKA